MYIIAFGWRYGDSTVIYQSWLYTLSFLAITEEICSYKQEYG